MPKKPATLQYVLFALVAAAAIAFYVADVASQYEYIWHGHERASAPVYFGLSNQSIMRTIRRRRQGFTKGIGCWK